MSRKEREMAKPRTTASIKHCNVIDLTQAAYTTFGVGPKRGNPRLCLHCGQPIKKGEPWSADTTAEDPDGYGRYTVIQHAPTCPDPKMRAKFQKMLATRSRASD
jgi:hypothetical protein